MNLEKQKAFIVRFIFIILILGLAYISIKFIVPLLMPFVIALIVASILRPFIDWIEKTTHLKRTVISIIVLIVFYGFIVLIINIFGVKIFSFLKDLFPQILGGYQNTVEPALDKSITNLQVRFPEIELYFDDIYVSIKDSIFSFLTKISTTVVGSITGFAGQVPSMLIKLVFTIVSSFFFTIDYHRIANFTIRQFSEGKRELVIGLKDNVIGTIGKFIKAYTTLITITFLELSIGFMILGVPNAILLAFVVAVVDILPILGTGAVLIPWIIVAFIFGSNSFAIGLLILYIIITVVRQTLEPRVVGQQIGLHPVVTLICMFVGAELLGVLGLLLLPVTATILKKMNDEGTIHFLK